MKIGKGDVTALYQWLFLSVVVFLLAGISARAYSDDTPGGGAKAPMSTGGFVDDPDANVPANAYVTFSTVFNGRRYYLGVDTVLAKSGKDTVMYYESPNYATMWIAGPMWSPTGKVLPTKDYTRTIQSVWLKEKVSRNKYLALGTGSGTYSTLRLLAEGTMWHTTKDDREPSKYINGFLYYYSDATGVDVYRYLRYDPVYGFSRLYETKPANSQRISVWDRKTGSDLIFDVQPRTLTAGYETNNHDTTKYPITSRVIYYENVDRFRSRFDHTDVYAAQSTPITDQSVLADPDGAYKLFGYYEWQSNPTVDPENIPAYNGKSCMKVWKPVLQLKAGGNPENPEDYEVVEQWGDSTMFYVSETRFKLDEATNIWHDTVYAIGSAPIDRTECHFLRKRGEGAPTAGDYANHNDWLYVKFQCKGVHYVDSIMVSRHTFHNAPFTTMTMNSTPSDHTFPYTHNDTLVGGTAISATDTAKVFDIHASYQSGNTVYNAVNAPVDRYIGENVPSMVLTNYSGHEEEGVWYDSLQVTAVLPDGTPAIVGAEGAGEGAWIESVRLTAKDKICVKVSQSAPEVNANRVAQITYTYRYWHSSAEGDQVTANNSIWVVQKWSGADNDKLYSFYHKDSTDNLQGVHERKRTIYIIPEDEFALRLHRDHWGYYRWYDYENDRDIENDGAWSYEVEPKNHNGDKFMPINITTSPTSRGRWDINIDNHFTLNTATPEPVIKNENPATQSIKVACDVSAYKNIEHTGEIGVSLTSVTEPTLSYRQVFDIQPAATQADKMRECRVGETGHNGWFEQRTIIAPINRELTFTPSYPIAAGVSSDIEPMYEEDELQYIYYCQGGQNGVENGTRTGLTSADLNDPDYYNRIGLTKRVNEKIELTLLSQSVIEGMKKSKNTSKTILLVNPRQGTGYALGNLGQIPKGLDVPFHTEEADMQKAIEDKLNDGGSYDAYYLTLIYTGSHYQIYKNGDKLWNLYTTIFGEGSSGNNIRWYGTSLRGDDDWDIHAYSGSSAKLPTGASGALVRIKSTWSRNEGWMAAGTLSLGDTRSDNRAVIHSGDGNNDANEAWLIYEVKTSSTATYRETPAWYMSTDNSSWTKVSHWDYSKGASVSDVAGYSMRPDGSLVIADSKLGTADQTIYYQLRTEHFQLAKITLLTRDPDKEGPKAGAGSIISEDEIENHYTVLYDLGMSTWTAPNTTEIKAYYHHFPWNFTEFSYHYPLSVINSTYRDSVTEMPMKGEYAFLNKFKVPHGGKNTGNPDAEFEALAGAKNGYMLCLNADSKRSTIMRFEYPALTCSSQKIYLVADLCNPVKNSFSPQITADLEGTKDGGETWETIYRFKTGKIPYDEEHVWYQFALPIDREHVKGYDYFRCTAMLDGATNKNAHLLIDRLRFIEKSRTFNVFQNKIECVQTDSVTALIRLNYKADTDLYKPGMLVAYQFQRWDASANEGAGGYVPMNSSTGKNDSVQPGYIKDAFTVREGMTHLKTSAGYDYGYVMVPEADYDPSLSNNTGKQSAKRGELIDAALEKLGITGDEANTRKTQFLNEKGNVSTIDQIISSGSIDFGTASTPHIKFFVKEGNDWVIYLACRLPIAATANKTFRIGMTMMDDLDDTPTFTESSCATFHTLKIKNATTLKVDGEDWTNHTRDEINADSGDELKPLAANETYRASVTFDPNVTGATNIHCRFDLLRVDEGERNQAATDEWWTDNYGCTRAQFFDMMATFRIDDEHNPMREVTNWNDVKPSDFEWSGRTPEIARKIYNTLNKLIVTDRKLEIGLEYRDIYLGNAQDGYFYLIPMPASGTYSHDGKSFNATVCNNPLWLELHTGTSAYSLRFGYDSKVGDSYIVPVIRASKTDANNHLKVRIADITHAATAGVVIGWDSTYVIESNDPEWNSSTKTFRYHQDRIVQDDLYDNYYKVPAEGEADMDNRYITFTPVNATYIARLTNTDCGCYDYDPAGTVYNYNKSNKEFSDNAAGVFKTPTTPTTGCNEWFVKPGTHDGHPTPGYQTPNNYELKAGYWYKFKTAFFSVSGGNKVLSNAGGDGTCHGHAEFIVAVAPDTVRWTPSHPDAANFWNDDDNWTAVVNKEDYHGAIATVPMKDTKVIIPKVEEGMAPIASDNVVESKDTLHYGYAKNTCSAILFYPNAQILGQEKLTYDKAYVDVPLTTGTWMTFSPALDDVYAGDMYIPFSTSYDKGNPASGASTDNEDFAPKAFPYGEGSKVTYNPRVYPFAFYQGFYNSAVPVAFYNTDKEGTPIETTMTQSTSSVDWVKTNALDMYYAPGKACVLTGYDATDKDGRPIVIRLPKPENSYCGFGKNGGTTYDAGPAVTLTRPNKLNRNLAYDQYAPSFSETDGLTYTLTNSSESKIFFFGNPTMSLVDVYRLCVANADVLKHEEGTYSFTAYNLIEDGNYIVKNITGPGQFFIAPMRAVGLIANATQTATKTLPIKLTPSALVAITGEGTIVHSSDIRPMPRRAIHIGTTNEKRLYIAASNETDRGVKKAYLTLGEQDNANRGYRFGEDALSITSGLNYYSNQSFSTPLSLYTIADNEALMQDIRDTLNSVPVVFATLDNHYAFDQYTFLTFALEGKWDKPVFLYDALTGDSIRIMDGMQIAVETPISNQLRYFINGGEHLHAGQNSSTEGVATGVEEINNQTNGQMANAQTATVYDLLGRHVLTLHEHDLLSNTVLPTGVYIISRGDKTERIVIR